MYTWRGCFRTVEWSGVEGGYLWAFMPQGKCHDLVDSMILPQPIELRLVVVALCKKCGYVVR